jgi:hypothetical protein
VIENMEKGVPDSLDEAVTDSIVLPPVRDG